MDANDSMITRRALLGGAIAAPAVATLGAGAARAAEGTSVPRAPGEDLPAFHPGDPWLDTDGNAIQGHGGQVLVSADAEGVVYYWYGEDRSNGYGQSPGVHGYSSRDLYNWTDEGVVLRTLTTPDELESDEYFTALYAGYDDDQKAAVIRDLLTTSQNGETAAILERPKVIHNESTGTWVLWVHADGPSETSTAQYAKARAGVAVSDSPFGPFRWIDSYRLHHPPEGEPDYQPGNPGMARDMNLFVDDDGTAYIIYSSEENYSLYISKLDDDYTYLATGPENAVKGVDFIRPYIGAHREAPALFKKEGLYYLITSGATGWDPNPASYATATEILGEWTDHGNPAHGDGAATTYRTQSTSVIPADVERGIYIYMGDRWTPSDLKNAPLVWLPLRFGEGTSMTLEWEDEWRWEDQPDQPRFTVDAVMPEFVRPGRTEHLPKSVSVRLADHTERRKVSWDTEPLTGRGRVELVGTLAGDEGLTFTRDVLVIPTKTRFLVSGGASDVPDWESMRRVAAQGGWLLNTAPDQALGTDPGSDITWGYTGRSKARAGSDLYNALRYATDHDTLTYRFEGLPRGTYTVHLGTYDPWPWANRAARVTLNGTTVTEQLLFAAEPKLTRYADATVGASGSIELSVIPTRSPDVQLSWIMVERQ